MAHGSGWHMCLLCPLACERDRNPLAQFFHTPSRPRAKQTSNIKTSNCDLAFHSPSLKEDSIASTICRKGPSTILLPLQEALNNYINLPKYGKKKKTFANQGGLACFPAVHWLLGKACCPVGRLLPLLVFPLIVGHMASLVLFNFLEASSTFWLQIL